MQQDTNWFYWNDLPTQIGDVSVLNDEKKNELLKKWNDVIWTKSVQSNDQKLSNIKELVAIKVTVLEWVMDRLKEAANDYVNGSWLSAIALSESICEFLTYYFLEDHIRNKGIDDIIEHSKKLKDQYSRLQLLKKLSIITEPEWKLLDDIRDLRNKYIHLNKIDFVGDQIKKDSLKVVNNLINFLNDKTDKIK